MSQAVDRAEAALDTIKGTDSETVPVPVVVLQALLWERLAGWNHARDVEREVASLRAELDQVKADYRDYARSMALGMENRAADHRG